MNFADPDGFMASGGFPREPSVASYFAPNSVEI